MNTDITINTNIKNDNDNDNDNDNVIVYHQPILPLHEPIHHINLQETPEPPETPDTPETPEPSESPEQNSIINEIFKKPLYMIYNENNEMNEEVQLLNYHKNKDCGYWKIAKMIIAHSNKDKNNTEFFLDYLDIQIHNNNDDLENIETVFYKNNLDIDIVYQFDGSVAKFIVENLKIFKYKPIGYVFNTDINQNKWNFTISVVTNKNIYTSNRYINENQIGYY